MTIMEMLGQSSVLTLLGMGIVFGFLVTMVLCVTAMGKIIHALGMDKDASASSGAASPASSPAKNAAVIAAITAAVNEYRKDN